MKVGYFILNNRLNFNIFAPYKSSVQIIIFSSDDIILDTIPLEKGEFGYWSCNIDILEEGTLYMIEVDGEIFPDPYSKFFPSGIHRYSQIKYPFPPEKKMWKGIGIDEAIIYELHVGTFTKGGKLIDVIKKLPHLKELGINVIELMPLSTFSGSRNWGYDGVYHFALQWSYGDYCDLRKLIQEANNLGIAVILDVVYNHLGPEGNYLDKIAPFTKDSNTPWGRSINFDYGYNNGIRDFYLEHVRYIIEDLGFDGFRFDATSLIVDTMATHILKEISDLTRSLERKLNRKILLIGEDLKNNINITSKDAVGFHSQWCDDFTSTIFSTLTSEDDRELVNFSGFPDLVKCLTSGFVMDGSRFDYYRSYFSGSSSKDISPSEITIYLENHDQVGNRVNGDRFITTYGEKKYLLSIATMFLSPFTPLLFMGNEYGDTSPFHFFEDFQDEGLIKGIKKGRKREFAFTGSIPKDPHLFSTFNESKLDWDLLDSEKHQYILSFVTDLIKLKKDRIIGIRDYDKVDINCDMEKKIIFIETPNSYSILNFSEKNHPIKLNNRMTSLLLTTSTSTSSIEGYGIRIFKSN